MKRRDLFAETSKIFVNGMLFRNPVLYAALGLYPVAAAGTSLRSAVELSLLFLLIALPTGLISCAVGQLLPFWARPGAVLAASALVFLPAARLTERVFPGSMAALGMFGGLMLCNSVILSRANEYAPTHIGWAVAADAVGCSVGFALVICLIAAVREYWLTGGLWNANDGLSFATASGVALPFFGFILLGFLAALLQWVNRKRSERPVRGGGRV